MRHAPVGERSLWLHNVGMVIPAFCAALRTVHSGCAWTSRPFIFKLTIAFSFYEMFYANKINVSVLLLFSQVDEPISSTNKDCASDNVAERNRKEILHEEVRPGKIRELPGL